MRRNPNVQPSFCFGEEAMWERFLKEMRATAGKPGPEERYERRGKRPVILSYPGSWTAQARSLVHQAGGDLWLLTPRMRVEAALELYQEADGVLLLGGADIDPAYYGEENLASGPGNPHRDDLEWSLATLALEEGKPLMGICRGHQMIAVAAGARLYQDIEWALSIPHAASAHPVFLREARFRRHFPKQTRLAVNSYHHQAVAQVPDGFTLEAVSLEGLIEALSAPQVRSVQWHPEALGDQTLFRWLVQRAPAGAPGRRSLDKILSNKV
jgi:putative glutamine amidotransferase